MKSEDNTLLEAKVADRNERAKKLYRYVADVARRIGDAIAGATTVTDLFTTNLEVQRQKLRDNCEKLLFFDPINYGKKSLELIWRKAYYEVVSTSKKLRQADSEYDSYLFTHIVCGIGHFHHIMAKIQSEMKIQVRELDYIEFHKDEETEDFTTEVKEDVYQFGRFALYSCLMYLGDLTRYQAEMFHTFEPSIAARYYLQAAHIDMTLGMPYNQLGNLYLDKNYNLDSVSYYIHCLSCDTPFEGAMGNLTKIFDKYSQYCDFNGSSEYSQSEHIQNTVANFLSLIEIWYLDKNDTNIPERCNSIAHGLKIAFDFKHNPMPDLNTNYKDFSHTLEEENINPSYLNNNLVHKIVEICLFTIPKMMETDETKAFACKAFTLALLAQLLQKLSQQLESFGFKNPANKYMEKIKSLREPGKKLKVSHIEDVMITEIQTNGTNGNNESEEIVQLSNDDGKKLTNGELKNNNKKILTKRRRRRRITSINSSDASEGESEHSASEIVISCSEEEEEDHISDSSISEGSKSEGSNEDSDLEVFDTKINGHVGEVTKHDGKETSNFSATKPIPSKELSNEKSPGQQSNNDDELKEKDIQNFLLGDNILPSLKLLQDWVHLEKDLILACGESGEPLFQSVVDLLNIFSHYFDSNNADIKHCKILEYSTNIAKKLKLEYKTIPLPEDVNLRGTNICKYDKDAAEWQILDRYKPTVYEENVIRILNFIDFGSQIANIVPQIKFNRTMKIYYLKKAAPPKLNTKISHKRGKEWHAAKKQEGSGLLRRLGRLWLAARVRELERAEPPALLAVDAHALADHLRIVKLLLKSKSFVLLVPTIVLQELDELKRSQSGARDAIRWLESALRGGGRGVRAQRPGQTRALPLTAPRRASPRLLHYINILEFCHHFVADDRPTHAGDGDDKSTPLLVLLIGNEHVDDEFKDFSLKTTAQAAGISVQYIGDFYTKWRQTAHRSGKKR